jgi:hypothetical protein
MIKMVGRLDAGQSHAEPNRQFNAVFVVQSRILGAFQKKKKLPLAYANQLRAARPCIPTSHIVCSTSVPRNESYDT